MDRIAVIIPLYNHETYIGKAMESVFVQSRRPDRLIVIDDGSKDGSVEAARRAAGAAPEGIDVVIREQTNAGAHAALNRGISLANDCNFVAILNSDDRYLPGRLARAVETLRANPVASLFCSGISLIGADGLPLPSSEPRWKWFDAVWSLAEEWKREELSLPEWLGIANFPATTSNFVARRAWLIDHPLRDYRYAHDYFALVQAAVQGALVISPEVELEYRVHPSNTISSAPEKIMAEMLRVNLDLAAALAPDLKSSPAVRKRWAGFQRASWASVSGLRQDLLQPAIASLLATIPQPAFAQAVEELQGAPEFREFPNKPLVNLRKQDQPFTHLAAMAGRIQEMRGEIVELKSRQKEARERMKADEALSKCSWVKIGRALGLLPKDGGLPTA